MSKYVKFSEPGRYGLSQQVGDDIEVKAGDTAQVPDALADYIVAQGRGEIVKTRTGPVAKSEAKATKKKATKKKAASRRG